MFIIRTITKSGDFNQLKSYDCIIKACSTAALLSDKALHGNAIVTNTKTRATQNFVNGRAI